MSASSDSICNIKYMDLFSGIGGHALALKGIAEPAGFCEINPFARSILEKNFSGVPIFNDVETLPSDFNLDQNNIKILTASFPCQDISPAGCGKGILEGTRSGLVWKVFDFMDNCCPNLEVVFMENSSALRNHGLQKIVEAFNDRGFRVAWGNLAASHLGARHRRTRIWIMAMKNDKTLNEITDEILIESEKHACEYPFKQLEKDIPRLREKIKLHKQNDAVRRWSALGNAIVPCVAKFAFARLLMRMRSNQNLQGELGFLIKKKIKHQKSDSSEYDDGESSEYPFLDLPNYPGYDTPQKTRMWLTPIHNSRHFLPNRSYGPGIRGVGMFATRVFYEKGTADMFGYSLNEVGNIRKQLELNPNWIEGLMGFPMEWTKK